MNHPSPTVEPRPRLRQALTCILAALQALPLMLISDVAHAQVAVTPQQTSPTQYRYDAQGSLTQVIEPDSSTTDLLPDRLHRTIQQTHPAPAAGAARPVVEYTYDGLDRLRSVKDPRGVTTGYVFRGLSDVVQYSADTGTSFSYGRADGQTKTWINTTADVRVTEFDALNRPLRVEYPAKSTPGLLGYTTLTYDEYVSNGGPADNYGRGRLTRVMQYGAPDTLIDSTSIRYDQHGRIVWKCQFIAGISAGSATSCVDANAVRYQWGAPGSSAADHLSKQTYPSGREVSYQYDALGRLAGVTTQAGLAGAEPEAVISSVGYRPMGVAASEHVATSWRYGAAGSTPELKGLRGYGNAGWLTGFQIGLGAVGWSSLNSLHVVSVDARGQIKTIRSARTNGFVTTTYTYDALGRLLRANTPGAADYSYEYDANGNRTLKTSAAVSTAYTYPSNSNRLASVQQGAAASQTLSTSGAGNITQDPASVVGPVIYTYEGRNPMPYGRLGQSQGPGAEWRYVHNHFGERIRKSGWSYTPSGGSAISPLPYVGSTDTVFYYDLGGQLIAEHDASTGQVKREYIWMGDIPVGVVAGTQPNQPISATNAAKLYYVFPDHLNTPRMVTDTAGNRRWQSDIMAAEPFGATAPNETPAGQAADQAFVMNLRFPGQYFDKETATAYNYFRSYNPETGRYLQSDPIGLNGGLNTYAYVNGNPLMYYDPYGLWAWGDPLPQDVVDASAGLGDALLWGTGGYLRDAFGIDGGVDPCSDAYRYGSWGALAAGGARLTYAGLVKGGSLLASSGLAASEFRSQVKTLFRLGVGKNWRPPDLSKYPTDAALRAAAGRSNPGVNIYGGGVAAAGAAGCGCPR